jgi:hypothetical protein
LVSICLVTLSHVCGGAAVPGGWLMPPVMGPYGELVTGRTPQCAARCSLGNICRSARWQVWNHEHVAKRRMRDPQYRRDLAAIAGLLRRRNEIDAGIAKIIGRPMTSGHLGEWIAARIFSIDLEDAAANPAFDGYFRGGPLNGRTVNIKWYLKQEGLLDMTESATLDFYLVLTGPRSAAVSSRSSTRPWRIDAAYLFDAADLLAQQEDRGIRTGIASSVPQARWQAAEIFPAARNPLLSLTPEQAALLRLFADPENPSSGQSAGSSEQHP